MGSYAIRGGADGKRRLDLLAHIMQPSTQALLARAGLAPGMRCLDLGCGGGHVSRYLAECVGAGGTVVGIDIDGVKLDAARTLCAQASLTNVQFRSVAVADWSDAAAYDLVYARFILSHLPDRPAVLARIGQALAPGGTVVLEDIDFGGQSVIRRMALTRAIASCTATSSRAAAAMPNLAASCTVCASQPASSRPRSGCCSRRIAAAPRRPCSWRPSSTSPMRSSPRASPMRPRLPP